MIEIEQSEIFSKWLRRLRDNNARLRITKRLKDITDTGHLGDHHSVGDGVSELRFHFGPGYRVYYTMRGDTLILLLGGGDKSTQSRDIEKAKALLNSEL